MRTGVLLCLLLAAGSAVATEIPLRPMQASSKQDTASIGARMADIETRLACGATKTDTIYVYRRSLAPRESISLAPSILVSDNGVRLLATPRHPRAGKVDSIRVLCGAGKATITRKAGTGADDFLTDRSFRSLILNAPRDEQVRVRLYGDSTSVEFLISVHERRAWDEIAYYLTNFSHRTGGLPATRKEPDGNIEEKWTPQPPGPKPIEIPEAYYPEKMKAAGVEAQIVVEMLVDTTGLVRTALVFNPQGCELLELAAVRAALDATFVPGRKRVPIEHTRPWQFAERPISVWAYLPYRFVLR